MNLDGFPVYAKKFRELFPDIDRSLNCFIDPELSLITRKPVFHIAVFDNQLHKLHGNYEDERGLSMRELIREKYGDRAVEFVLELISV